MSSRRPGRLLERLPQRLHECWTGARGIRELSRIAIEVLRANLARLRETPPKHWTEFRTRDGE